MGDFALKLWDNEGRYLYDFEPQTLSWGGADRDCARSLSFSVVKSVQVPLGGIVKLYRLSELLFSGRIVSRSRDSLSPTVECRCLDGGIYLKRNSVVREFRDIRPEQAAADLCREFGIPCGHLASTGVPISRIFMGVNLYAAIMTMYSLAADKTGCKYQAMFRGEKLEVRKKEWKTPDVRLINGQNVLSCGSQDSIEGLTTAVNIYSETGALIRTVNGDAELRRKYGRMEEALRHTEGEDLEARAKTILEEHGVATTIPAHCLGDTRLVAGSVVHLYEPVANANGSFWVVSDQHQVKDGVYTTDVDLEYKLRMDHMESGSAPDKKKGR